MRIGIDLDGCVYNFVDALRNHFVSKGVPAEHMPEPDQWEIWECWGMSKEQFVSGMIDAEAAGLFHQGQAYSGAIDALRELAHRGHSIHIITHRLRPHAQTSTIGWPNANDVPYDTLTFSGDKAGYPVDICIDDNVENAHLIEQDGLVPCVVMTRPWNSSLTWSRRVTSWEQFVELIQQERDIARIRHHVQSHRRGEVRQTSPTGGEKSSKPEQYSMIPVAALAEVARVYGFGADKYARDNWRKGYPWHLSYDALQRHVNAFWAGQDFDTQSGLHHLAHAAFHCFALMTFGGDLEQYAMYDDRQKSATGDKALH